ncbi:uncharacterized protein LOC114557367 [Tachysurus ichikawai]
MTRGGDGKSADDGVALATHSALTHLERKKKHRSSTGMYSQPPPVFTVHSRLCRKANIIFKFAEDTTILGLITDGNERAGRDKCRNKSN